MVRLGGADRAVHARRQTRPSAVPGGVLLRIHFMQQWFTLSDPAMEEALHDMPLFRDFAGLGGWDDACPTRAPSCDSAMCWRRQAGRANPGNRQFAAGCQGLMLRSGTWSMPR